jgi:hypothetical protein
MKLKSHFLLIAAQFIFDGTQRRAGPVPRAFVIGAQTGRTASTNAEAEDLHKSTPSVTDMGFSAIRTDGGLVNAPVRLYEARNGRTLRREETEAILAFFRYLALLDEEKQCQ